MSDTIHFSVIYVPSDLSEQCLSNRDNSPECPLKSEQQLVKSENSGTEDAELTAYEAETWQMKLNIWVVCWIVTVSFAFHVSQILETAVNTPFKLSER